MVRQNCKRCRTGFLLWAGGTVQSPHGADAERRLRRGSRTAGERGAAGNARRSAGRGTGTVPAARHCAYSVCFGLPCGRAGRLAGAADDAGEASAASDGADIADTAGVRVPDRRERACYPCRAALGNRLLGPDSPQAGADAACAVRIGNDSADVCARTAVQRVVPNDVRRDGGDLRDNGADRPERAEKAWLEGKKYCPCCPSPRRRSSACCCRSCTGSGACRCWALR